VSNEGPPKKRRQARRASAQEQTGSVGIAAVSAQFARLNWGPVENSRHDLGTDLFIQVRDRRLFDLGLVVGAQVKTGPSYFKEPTEGTDEEPPGWWFRDSDESHTDFWASHGLPHLLVLHDPEASASYWVHVTSEVVIGTGTGAKILVPRANTIDEQALDQLLAVAGTGRPDIRLEGTAWTGATPPAAQDRLRFALVVPRLVAPHPNAGMQPDLTPVQATGLLMQARFDEYARHAEEFDNVPSFDEAQESETWAWRFVGACGARIIEAALDPMRTVLDDAPDAAGSVAATVVIAAALIEQADVEGALKLLDRALANDDASPVDDAWLRLQRARALLESGSVDTARAEAIRVQAVRSTSRHDVTATAITGIAATVLFNTADRDKRDVATVIKSSDTVAAWWRTQTTLRGVTAVVERTFEEWTADESVTLGGSDEANNQLFVAALTAAHTGDHGAWRRLSSSLAKDSLLRLGRRSEAGEMAAVLSSLRRAGDEKALKRATRRVAHNGPAIAVTQAGAELSLEDSTRTTAFADLELISQGGDLLDPEVAEKAGQWLVATLDDPERFLELTSSRIFSVEAKIVETLVGLMTVVPELGVDFVIERLPTVIDKQETVQTQTWRKLLSSIPKTAWTEDKARELDTSETLAPDVRTAALGVAARFDSEARETLTAQAGAGSLQALQHFGPASDLEPGAAHGLIQSLAPSLERARRDAREGKVGFGPYDVAQVLAVLVSHHPDEAVMVALLEYLGDEAIPRGSKHGALCALALNRDLLPEGIPERLVTVAERTLQQRSRLDGAPFGDPDIAGVVGFIAGAMGGDRAKAATEFLNLLAGPATQRKWAASLAGAATDELAEALPAMVQDEHPRVRAAAAGELARRVAGSSASPVATTALRSAAADPGRQPPLAIVSTLSGMDWEGNAPREVLEQLRNHASAAIRAHAADALKD
jgi:hypothetical protein